MKKAHRMFRLAPILVPMLCLTGCLEFESTTVVHRDGSLTRTIVVTGDSAEVRAGRFPIIIDSSWAFVRDTTSEGKYRITAEQTFEDDAALNTTLNAKHRLALRITTKCEHSFRWFSDLYEYTETWHRFDPFESVPVTDFISPAELELVTKYGFGEGPFDVPGDSLAIRDIDARFEQWRQHNMFESFYAVFLAGLKRLDRASLTREDAELYRDSLFHSVSNVLDQGRIESAVDSFVAVIGHDDVAAAFAANREGIEEYTRRLRFAESVWKHDYRVRIQLPGILLDTNAPAVEGNTALWDDYINICYVIDVDMYSRSQALNWWMISLTFLVAVLLLAFFIAGLFRRRRRFRYPDGART